LLPIVSVESTSIDSDASLSRNPLRALTVDLVCGV